MKLILTEGKIAQSKRTFVNLRWKPEYRKLWPMDEIIFEVTQEADGGFVAECLTEAIFTQASNWEGLRLAVREAVSAFYFDRPQPRGKIRLHLVRDEVLA